MKHIGEFEERISKLLSRATSTGRRGFLTTIAKGFALITGIGAGLPREFLGQTKTSARTRRLLYPDWRFTKGDPPGNAVSLFYDLRPQAAARRATINVR